MGRYHIVIEGTDDVHMQKFFEEIQNKYSLYDNCAFGEVTDDESIIEDEDRCAETGGLECKRPVQSPIEPEEDEE